MENPKRDPYNHEKRWYNWKESILNGNKTIENISKRNSDIIIEFLFDMELGRNTTPGSKVGERSYVRLNSLKTAMMFFAKRIEKDFDKITEEDIHMFFNNIKTGKMLREDGKKFKGTSNFVKDFKAFWSWMVRTKKVPANITAYLSRKDAKPGWVYLTEEQFKTFANSCNPTYRALVWFMYDTGLRVTEANSIKIKDFSENFTKLTVHPEVSKTIGRKISLKLCSTLIKEYVQINNLTGNDYLFIKKIHAFNSYIRDRAEKLFGTQESPARECYNRMTLYDIRHNACCYWIKRYPKTAGLMYRMGWKKEAEVHYYSEFLGMSDEISDEDMVTAEDRTRLTQIERDYVILKQTVEEKNNIIVELELDVKGLIKKDIEKEFDIRYLKDAIEIIKKDRNLQIGRGDYGEVKLTKKANAEDGYAEEIRGIDVVVKEYTNESQHVEGAKDR